MDADTLAHSAQTESSPPTGISETLRTLWLARADRWDEAHELCQNLPDPAGAWLHAYLHRVEGDLGNAAYWYSRAGQPLPAAHTTVDQEWHDLASHFSV